MASYHRLSTTLKAWANYSRQQLETTLSNNVAPAQQTDEEFCERRRTEALNNFNNRDLIQIAKEAKETMAFNDIEPIIVPPIPYGEREPYQEVKAHLISPFSKRVSAASRSVCDNWISQRGYKPLIISNGPDKVSYRPNSDISDLTSQNKATIDDYTSDELLSLLSPEVVQSILQLYNSMLAELPILPPANYNSYLLMCATINVVNTLLFKIPFTPSTKMYLLQLTPQYLRFEQCSCNKDIYAWAAQHSNEGWFVSPVNTQFYTKCYEVVRKAQNS